MYVTVFDLPALRQPHSVYGAVFLFLCMLGTYLFVSLTIHFLSECLGLYSPCLMTCVLHRLDLDFTSHPKDPALL